jgi:hypothetical protein
MERIDDILDGKRRIVYPGELAETKAKLPVPHWDKR